MVMPLQMLIAYFFVTGCISPWHRLLRRITFIVPLSMKQKFKIVQHEWLLHLIACFIFLLHQPDLLHLVLLQENLYAYRDLLLWVPANDDHDLHPLHIHS